MTMALITYLTMLNFSASSDSVLELTRCYAHNVYGIGLLALPYAHTMSIQTKLGLLISRP